MPAAPEGSCLVVASFDMLHVGHVRILADAREVSSRLIVGIVSDALQASVSGVTPFMPEHERAELVGALTTVDLAVPVDSADLGQLIREHGVTRVLVDPGLVEFVLTPADVTVDVLPVLARTSSELLFAALSGPTPETDTDVEVPAA